MTTYYPAPGSQGKYSNIWQNSLSEISEILGEDLGEQASEYWNIEQKGSFEGKNIPRLDSAKISDLAVEDTYSLTPENSIALSNHKIKSSQKDNSDYANQQGKVLHSHDAF